MVSENYLCHHVQCDLPSCGLVLQRDLRNRKVRKDESVFLVWQNENMSRIRSWCRAGSGVSKTMKKGSVWLTLPQGNTKNWLFCVNLAQGKVITASETSQPCKSLHERSCEGRIVVSGSILHPVMLSKQPEEPSSSCPQM